MLHSGQVFSIARDNEIVEGCTVSETVLQGSSCCMTVFSLAAMTNISPESYGYPKIWKIEEGGAKVLYLSDDGQGLKKGDIFVVPQNIPVGIKTEKGCVYSEIIFFKECAMNSILKSAEIFKLKDLLPYKEGKVVNMDLVDDQKAKFVIMSFDEGTGLPEHSAPGDAIVFGLEGEGIIGSGGKEYRIHEGENFKFDKNGSHYVKASGKFKMALLLIRG
ncbi:cupin domain-containing protein [Treponema parvum]|uniref:Cupin domain-containing protein n=1 Tax=Treponema parvum TaxID=138851 RepID=A0A975EZB4_9SPIR|nr:cupin domain-containing protein [Treponema parvum]QTQ11552.1 cupin domain-containing protein [Treponema parvum]